MKVVYAEIKKLICKNSYWVITGIMTLFVVLLFYQKGYNANSGYYQPELCKGDYYYEEICLYSMWLCS